MKFSTLFLFLFLMKFSLGQNVSGIFNIEKEDLTYNNIFEKNAFEDLDKRDKSLFNLLMSPDNHISFEQANKIWEHIDSIAISYKNEISTKKSNKKVLEKLYSDIKNKYLKEYRLSAPFSEIFSGNTYNCVSGSAFYALLLSKLEIPYIIRLAPQHVYLVVEPNLSNIIFEATALDASSGYLICDKKSQKDMLSYLSLIGELNYMPNTRNENNEATIQLLNIENTTTLQELCAIQYSNLCLEAIGSEALDEALLYAEKSYVAFNNPSNTLLLQNLITNKSNKIIINQDTTNIIFLKKFIKYLNEDNKYFYISEYFKNLVNKDFVKKLNIKEFEKIYSEIHPLITNKTYQDEIQMYRARGYYIYYYLKKNITKAEPYLHELYSLAPDNLDNQAMVADYLENRCQQFKYNIDYNEEYRDIEFLYLLDSIKEKFSFLKEDGFSPNIQQLYDLKDFILIDYYTEEGDTSMTEKTLKQIALKYKSNQYNNEDKEDLISNVRTSIDTVSDLYRDEYKAYNKAMEILNLYKILSITDSNYYESIEYLKFLKKSSQN